MKQEFNENPCEQKSSQVGNKASCENKKVNYIVVVPSLPMYCISYCEIAKVLKMHIPLQRTPNFGVLELLLPPDSHVCIMKKTFN